jgi:hypothetical protein
MMMEKMDKLSDDMLVDLHQTLKGNTARLERAVKDYQLKIKEHRVNILKMDEEIKMRGIGLQRH